MNPFKIPDDILNQNCITFTIERNNKIVSQARGFFCGRDYPHTIQLVDIVDVQIDDCLIASTNNLRYYAQNIEILNMGGDPCDMMIEYLTEKQYKAQSHGQSQTIFNIGNISGNNVIGNENISTFNISATISNIESLISNLSIEEKALGEELLTEIKKINDSTHPVLIEGTFSRFSDLLKKHTDLITAIGGWCVQLLIGK